MRDRLTGRSERAGVRARPDSLCSERWWCVGARQRALPVRMGHAPVLAEHLQLVRKAGATRRGYFLRAETMHGLFTYLEKNPRTSGVDIPFHDMSHGESFLELAVDRLQK